MKQVSRDIFARSISALAVLAAATAFSAPASVTYAAEAPAAAAAAPAAAPAKAEGVYTGLVVDCRGLGLRQNMSPVIKNTDGEAIYGAKDLDYDKVVIDGMVGYSQDINSVARAGSHPLIVSAVSLEHNNTYPIVSDADAARVLLEDHATGFLKKLNVVFVY